MQIILDSRYLLVDPYYSETWNFIVDPHIPFMTNWSIVTQAEYTEGWLRHNFMMIHMRMRMGRVVILKMSLLINEIGLGLIYLGLNSQRNSSSVWPTSRATRPTVLHCHAASRYLSAGEGNRGRWRGGHTLCKQATGGIIAAFTVYVMIKGYSTKNCRKKNMEIRIQFIGHQGI